MRWKDILRKIKKSFMVAKKNKKEENGAGIFYALSVAWQMGIIIVVGIGGALWGGLFLDRYFATQPLFLIIGFMFGVGITFYELRSLIAPLLRSDDVK